MPKTSNTLKISADFNRIDVMELIEVLKKRRSVRKYLDKDVPAALIREIIEQANLAPSAGNIQARSVVIVKDQFIIEKIRSVAKGFSRFEGKIPVILIILAKLDESAQRYAERGRSLYALQDATIFAAYLQLVATEKGLSTGWVGNLDEKKLAKIVDLSKEVLPVAIIPLGYATLEPSVRERKSLNEIILKQI